MDENGLILKRDALLKEFDDDSRIVGEQTEKFLRLVYPSYLTEQSDIETFMESDSSLKLESMTFFRIASCTVDNDEKAFETVSECFEKLFTALHSINIPVAYGIISSNKVTNLVFGIYQSRDVECVKRITEGMLSGIEIVPFTPEFTDSKSNRNYGILAGVPSLIVKEEK